MMGEYAPAVDVVYKHLYFILKAWYQKHRLTGFETFNFHPYLPTVKKSQKIVDLFLFT